MLGFTMTKPMLAIITIAFEENGKRRSYYAEMFEKYLLTFLGIRTSIEDKDVVVSYDGDNHFTTVTGKLLLDKDLIRYRMNGPIIRRLDETVDIANDYDFEEKCTEELDFNNQSFLNHKTWATYIAGVLWQDTTRIVKEGLYGYKWERFVMTIESVNDAAILKCGMIKEGNLVHHLYAMSADNVEMSFDENTSEFVLDLEDIKKKQIVTTIDVKKK